MNPAIAIPQHGVELRKFDELATLAGLSPSRTRDDLSPKLEKLLESIRSIVNDMVRRAIEQKTADDFHKVAEQVFPPYFALSLSLSMVAEQAIPMATLERLIAESCSEAESTFRETDTVAILGSALRDQAIFTIWTIRKTSDLLFTIAKTPIAEDQKNVDAQFAKDFSLSAVWTQFNMACVSAAIQSKKTIYPEVSECILDGLRSAVNAYAYARQGMELRMPLAEPEIAPYQWDEEDQELLNSSMAEMDEEDA